MRNTTQHLDPKATAMTRNSYRLRKAEANREIFTASRRMAEIEHQLQILKKDHANRVPKIQPARQRIRGSKKSNVAPASNAHRSVLLRKTYGMAVRGESSVAYHRNRPPGDHPWPRPAYSDPARELAHLLARGASIGRIAAGHHFRGVNCLSGSCEPFEP